VVDQVILEINWGKSEDEKIIKHHQENPYFTFCAFSCFFMLFAKFLEKAQKSQVTYLPECFLR